MTTAARTLSPKGRQTRQAIETAARTLFAERGFHGTTLTEITAAAGRSPAVFYRYFDDKVDLLAALAESLLSEVTHRRLQPSTGNDFFASVVSDYWEVVKQNIGVMIAVDQLAATDPRFARMQNEFRRSGMDTITSSVRRAQDEGHATGLDAEHIGMAITLLFERFTAVCLRPDAVALGFRICDEDAVATLSAIWRRTLYGSTGDAEEITPANSLRSGALDGRHGQV